MSHCVGAKGGEPGDAPTGAPRGAPTRAPGGAPTGAPKGAPTREPGAKALVTFIDARQAAHLAKDPRNECFAARWHGGVWESINTLHGGEPSPSLFPEGPALQKEFACLFNDKAVPSSPIDTPEFPIDTTGPPCSAAPARLHGEKKEALRTKVMEYASRQLVERCVSPWNSRPLLVWEEAKQRYRLCIDYRALNARTAPMRGAMPHVEDVWSRLDGCTVFSVYDLPESFHQLRLREADRDKTAFTDAEGGQWRWTVCPFGLRNVPHWMQAAMQQVAGEVAEQMAQRGIRGTVVVWMDDVLLATATREEHAIATRLLFEVSLSHNIHYKPSSQMGMAEVVWAGFRLSAEGHQVALSRTEGIQAWKAPTTRQGLQRLTGWVQWAAQGVPHIARLLAPFYAQINEPHVRDLTEEMVDLKAALTADKQWLAYSRLGAPFEMYTDASLTAIGASIWQQGRPVAHLSHALSRCQRDWPVRDREMFAVIWTLQRCPWLRGSEIKVFVDHESLAEDQPEAGKAAAHYSKERWAKWTRRLLSHNIEFHWVPGKEHAGPDYLSRVDVPHPPPCPPECATCRCREANVRDSKTWAEVGARLAQLRGENRFEKGVVRGA